MRSRIEIRLVGVVLLAAMLSGCHAPMPSLNPFEGSTRLPAQATHSYLTPKSDYYQPKAAARSGWRSTTAVQPKKTTDESKAGVSLATHTTPVVDAKASNKSQPQPQKPADTGTRSLQLNGMHVNDATSVGASNATVGAGVQPAAAASAAPRDFQPQGTVNSIVQAPTVPAPPNTMIATSPQGGQPYDNIRGMSTTQRNSTTTSTGSNVTIATGSWKSRKR